jgi:peptidyl-prolyl cis-trans isomerase C
MMRKIILAALPLLFMACLFGSAKIMKPDAEVASVNGRIVTFASYDSTVEQIQKNISPEIGFDDIKRAALDSLINHQLLGTRKDSIRDEINNDWAFNQGKLEDITQTIFKVLFEKQISSRILIDTATVTKYYDDNKEKYIDPEQVKAKHILIRRPKPDTAGTTSEKEQKRIIEETDKFARDRAEAVLKKALDGENWDTLAATYSEDQSNAKKGGDLGYFFKGRMMPEFDSASFAAQLGAIVGPVSTRHGYHIILVEDHKPSSPKPYSPELSAQIFHELLSEEERKLSSFFLDSLKAAASYAYNDELLSLPDTMINDVDWTMAVNATDTVYGAIFKESLPKFKRWKEIQILTIDNKKELLELMANNYLLRSAARSFGYLADPEVVRASDEAVTVETNLRLSSFVNDLKYEPTEEEIGAYFSSHIDDYKEQRPILVHHILFTDSVLAEHVRDSLVAGADFAEMARRYYPGDPDIREVLFNLDYIGPEEMGSDFYGAASALDVGGVSHPVKTDWGYHLIKLVNRKHDKTLAQVRPGIRQRLKEARNAEKTSKMTADWRKNSVIKVNEEALKKYQPEEKKVIRIEARASEPK